MEADQRSDEDRGDPSSGQGAEHAGKTARAEPQVVRDEAYEGSRPQVHAARSSAAIRSRKSSSRLARRPARGAQFGERSLSDQPPVGEDADAVGDALGDLENMRRQDDRGAFAHARGQHVLHLPRRARVEAGQRLVEHQETRLVHQRAGERDLLLHPTRKTLAALAPVLPEAERLEQRLRAFRRAARLDAPQPCDEFEIFERVELVIEQRLVRQPGDDPLGRDRLAARVDPKNVDFAAVGGQEAGDHAQSRRFARPVGAEQGVEFARAHGKVETIDRRPGEALGQRTQHERRRRV